jgi:hypothetical protein
MSGYVFPRWANSLRPVLAVVVLAVPVYVIGVFALAASPRTTDVGYAPEQPVAYSHALHAGQLGIDCRYCHSTVESAATAAIPPTQTCMNCHATVRTESEKLTPVRLRYEEGGKFSGMPVEWVRVHDLPDYVYFNHSAHVRHGVGCVSCHGRVDNMEVVHQAEVLSMGWCLSCHRSCEERLRPLGEITDMTWTSADPVVEGRALAEQYGVHPSTDCSTCHR